MAIEIFAIGGYYEVGKNMTAIKVDDEIVVMDMGLHLPNYIRVTEEEMGEDPETVSEETLRKAGAVPDDSVLKKMRHMVKAIIPTHAHLDHVGAIPHISGSYNAPVIGTPYTIAVIRAILKDSRKKIKNNLITVNVNSTYQVSKNIKAEFINITHSTPQTAMVALHTKYGIVLYANDFKFDNNPVLGKKPNYEALARLGKEGVTAVITDSLYARDNRKTPSESVAREMLRDVMLGVNSKGKAVIVTTFSSHLARLRSIVEFGKQMGRRVVMIGRSLKKYVDAGQEVGLVKFKDVKMVGFSREAKEELKKIQKKGREKYLIVVTGHQGEPKAMLSKMANKVLPWEFHPEDHVIFSSSVIPTEINQKYRGSLLNTLKKYGVRIFTDIHVSGHAGREDLRDFLHLINAKHVIPAHVEEAGENAMIELCQELGYKKEKTVHSLRNGQKLVF